MQICNYKNRQVVPAIHAKGPRDYYATFCIEDGKTRKCFTIRPNFKTQSEAREAAYRTGRAKIDTLENPECVNLSNNTKQPHTDVEKRSSNTIYLSS